MQPLQTNHALEVNQPVYRLSDDVLNANNPLHVGVAKLASNSLHELKRLRILLSRLLSGSGVGMDEVESDEESEPIGEASDELKASSYSDGRLCDFEGTEVTTASSIPSPLETTGLCELVHNIKDSIGTLDRFAGLMPRSRLHSRGAEFGLQAAMNLLTSADQLEFRPRSGYFNHHQQQQQVGEGNVHIDADNKRAIDWLTDRLEAERWSHRYKERRTAVLQSLTSCCVLRRSHLCSDTKQRKWYTATSAYRCNLEEVLNRIASSHPKMSLSLIEPGSNLAVVHVKVGEVMQCFVTFRRLHPERIIVRGLSEPMLLSVKGMFGSSTNHLLESEKSILSKPMEDLLNSRNDICANPEVSELLHSLLSPEVPPSRPVRRSNNSRSTVQILPVSLTQLDLVTPSRHQIFQRISALAQCALLHFSDDYKPPFATNDFFSWLAAYHDLFVAPCARCKQLLGRGAMLPVWRSYQLPRMEDMQKWEPLHEQCQSIG